MARVGKLRFGIWLVFAVSQLHAGFIGTTCTDNNITCVTGNTNTTISQGSTSFTFIGTTVGGLVGGKPTIGSLASLEVSDPSGVPTSSKVSLAYETFTDRIPLSSVALFYSFTLDFHVNNSLNYFNQGFPTAQSELFLVVTGRDAADNVLWHTTNFDFTPIDINTQGSSSQTVTFTTSFALYNPATANLDISLTSTSMVAYSNSTPHTAATDVLAFSDASHTIVLDTVQGQDFSHAPMGPALFGNSGANYSNTPSGAVPEPQTFGLMLLGGVPLLLAARRRRQVR